MAAEEGAKTPWGNMTCLRSDGVRDRSYAAIGALGSIQKQPERVERYFEQDGILLCCGAEMLQGRINGFNDASLRRDVSLLGEMGLPLLLESLDVLNHIKFGMRTLPRASHGHALAAAILKIADVPAEVLW